ncbi:MAG: aminotransferase class I/II-fold pyridoxal phosphate-dependent enzyme [Myxococcota bacterium]
MKDISLATLAVHRPGPRVDGSVVDPIFVSANYLQGDASTYDDVRYARLSNTPQQRGLARTLARLEDAEAALPVASGMAAISVALLSVLAPGDHVLVPANLYGGTVALLDDLRGLGIASSAFRDDQPLTDQLRPKTRAIYVEAISNPLLEVPDLQAVVDTCRERGLVSIIDATFVSPVGFRPVPFGFDLVVHSATKYLNGHSDLIAGVIAGSQARINRALTLQNHLGPSIDAHAAFLLDRGLKTLALRVPRQATTAGRIAAALQRHPAVSHVRYPGLPDDPNHARARTFFEHFGGMIAFDLVHPAVADRLVEGLELWIHAASLGAVESLIVRPAQSSHVGIDPHERRRIGISDTLFRLSVGIEDADDLIADLEQALSRAGS